MYTYKFTGTQGNWKTHRISGCIMGIGVESQPGFTQMVCESLLPDTDEEYEKIEPQILADMSLISAAPDLLQALTNMNNVLDDMWNDNNRGYKTEYYNKKIQKAQQDSLKAIHKALNIK